MLERGDIVVYCYPKAPEWHGTLAIVDTWEVLNPEYPEYPIWILEYVSVAPGFPYVDHDNTPWHKTAWKKVGHIDLPTG